MRFAKQEALNWNRRACPLWFKNKCMDKLDNLEISVNGLTLAGLRRQSGGPRVLACHGWLDNAHSFLPLAGELENLDLFCLDWPGHGRSDDRPAGCRYHFDDYVWDVLGAADALGWKEFHLLGHSLGGAACALVAAGAPERIRSLTLIEGVGPLSTPAGDAAAQLRAAVEKSRYRPRRLHAGIDSAIKARAINGDLGMDAARLLAERGLLEKQDGWQWRHDLRLTWPSSQRYTEPQVLNLLGAIEAPVLAIGAEPPSGIIPEHLLQRRLAALRNSTVRSHAGGHHLHMKHPGELAPWILDHIHENDSL